MFDAGTVFDGKYRIIDALGSGASATVYRAQVPAGGEVALKVFDPSTTDRKTRDKMAKRFVREAKILHQLQSPHIVRLLGFGQVEGGVLYQVCEVIEGRSLAELSEDGAVSERLAVEILEQTMRGLSEAHDAGVLHRDIKPSNIMISERSGLAHVTVIDFGIAKPAKGVSESKSGFTQIGAVVGTPKYMSPEQLFGMETDEATDIYSAGLSILEALGLTPPGDVSERVHLAMSTTYRVPTGKIRDTRLKSVLEKMVQGPKQFRYTRCAQVLDDLARAEVGVSAGLVSNASREKLNELSLEDFEEDADTSTQAKSRWIPLVVLLAFLVTIVFGATKFARDPEAQLEPNLATEPQEVAEAEILVDPIPNERSEEPVEEVEPEVELKDSVVEESAVEEPKEKSAKPIEEIAAKSKQKTAKKRRKPKTRKEPKKTKLLEVRPAE